MHLSRTNLPSTLDDLQIFLERYLIAEAICQGQHILEDMIIAHLSTLDMMHFPCLLRTITFSSQSSRNGLNDNYVFSYISHEERDTGGQWFKMTTYQTRYEKWQQRRYEDDDED